MANEQNLRPCEYKFTQEDAKKGARNSAKARREKKTIQKILNDYLNENIEKNPKLEKLAEQLGLSGQDSIKSLLVISTVMRTIQKGGVIEIEKVAQLLGEQIESDEEEKQKQQDFLSAIEKAVKDDE